MGGNLVVNHVALAPANRRHVDGDGTGHDAEFRGVTSQMRDFGAANLILTRHAGDVRAGSADPSPLHHGSPSARSRHMPSDELATSATAKDQDFKSFRLRHALSPCADSTASVDFESAASARTRFFRYCSDPAVIARYCATDGAVAATALI
jgi:hypothetical protein